MATKPTERSQAPSSGPQPDPRVDPALLERLGSERWQQSWPLTAAIHTPVADPDARRRWATLELAIRPLAAEAFDHGGERTALDLRCGEGWLAHRLLEWGADRVVGLEDRPEHLARARLLKRHFGLLERRLELCDASGPDAGAATAHPFDLTLLIGATDRLQANAADELSAARLVSGSTCVLEVPGSQADPLARAAVSAGFDSVELLPLPAHAAPAYVRRDLVLLVAWASEAP